MHTKFWFKESREEITWEKETWNFKQIRYEGSDWI
jgi:hypothetical protein